MSALDHVLLVKYALGEKAEKAGHAVFQHLAARRKQGAIRRQGFAQGQRVG